MQSLSDLLNTHSFPPMGTARGPLAGVSSSSPQTTTVDPSLVARCILQANHPLDVPNPYVTFKADASILGRLQEKLDDMLVPDATVSDRVNVALSAMNYLIPMDRSVNETDHYHLCLSTYGDLTRTLCSQPELFRSAMRLLEWHLARAPEGATHNGKADLEVIKLGRNGVPLRARKLWEYKRNIVLDLNKILEFLDAMMSPDGVRLGLDRNGFPCFLNVRLSETILKWCSQVGPFRILLPFRG